MKTKIAIVLLTLIVGVEGILYVEYQNKYYEIRSSYIKMEREYTTLQNQYTGLGQDYDDLESEYSMLKESYSSLLVNGNSSGQYIGNQSDYVGQRESIMVIESYLSSLRESYINLRENYDIEVALGIGNTLESYYDLLRYEKGLTISHWGDLQIETDFCAKLALHALGRNCWPTVENKYYVKTGKHSYEIARRKIMEVIGLIGIQPYHTPTYKIKKILSFMQQNIHYEDELGNVYLSPIETLAFKSGDCDDFSILASALFEAVGIDSAFGIFKNAEGKYHCMVLVHLEDLGGYRYSSYPDLTSEQLDKGTWIVIEPQNTIDQQDFDSLETFSLVAVAPLD